MEFSLQIAEPLGTHPLASKAKSLMERYSDEFVPPLLIADQSSDQSNFDTLEYGAHAHFFDVMAALPAILVTDTEQQLAGLLCFELNVPLNTSVNGLCVHLIIVDHTFRANGLAEFMYKSLLHHFSTPIFTRTWSTNVKHIGLLQKMGFKEAKRIANHRSLGIDTVYYLFNNDKTVGV
jgi:ribosomal protein S18 acetylase RimI-like enzyme